MLTLAVTSSTATVAVAIADGEQVLAERSVVTDRRHAEELTPMISGVLADAGVALAGIGQFAVDVGPGRFTGLRVGIATVRTLALATGKLIVPVTSLETLATPSVGATPAQPTSPRSTVAVIDARRSEVFQQRFDADGSSDDASYGTPEEMAGRVRPGDVVIGDGFDRYEETYRAATSIDGRVGVEPSAGVIALIAAGREALPGPQVIPLYLRDPDVQINIKTRNNT